MSIEVHSLNQTQYCTDPPESSAAKNGAQGPHLESRNTREQQHRLASGRANSEQHNGAAPRNATQRRDSGGPHVKGPREDRGPNTHRRPASGRGEGRGRGGGSFSVPTDVGPGGHGPAVGSPSSFAAARGDAGGAPAMAAANGTGGLAGPGMQSNPAARGFSSANHLLNFSYDSGRGGGRGGGGAGSFGSGQGGPGQRRFPTPKAQKYDRNKFLQANFRFLVSDAVDVASFAADADKMFDWDDVVQVQMMSPDPVVCPISLDSPPLCPAITPCGHIFSFPAIMQHLLNYGGDALRRSGPCPLCFAPLVARELRLASVLIVKPPKVGDTITFSRLTRLRGSMLPQPATTVTPVAAATDITAAAVTAPREESTATGISATASPAPPATNLPSVWDPVRLASGSSGSSSAGGVGGRIQKGGGKEGTAAVAAIAGEGGDAFQANRFSKFVVSERGQPLALWKAAARELAVYAAEVTSAGGLEAALEAPSIYAALDALAARARKWTHHRVESFASRGISLPEAVAATAAAVAAVAGDGGGLSAHAAAAMASAARGGGGGGETQDVAALLAAEAEAEIKKEFTATTTKANSRGSAHPAPQPQMEFPALPSSSAPPSSTTSTLRSAASNSASSQISSASSAQPSPRRAEPTIATTTVSNPPSRNASTDPLSSRHVPGNNGTVNSRCQDECEQSPGDGLTSDGAEQQLCGGRSEEWDEAGQDSQDCDRFDDEDDDSVDERMREGLHRGQRLPANFRSRKDTAAFNATSAGAHSQNRKQSPAMGSVVGSGSSSSGLSVSAAVFAPTRTSMGQIAAAVTVPSPSESNAAAASKDVEVLLQEAKQNDDGVSGSSPPRSGRPASAAANGKNTKGRAQNAATANAVTGLAPEEFCTYQSSDGQWVFLHPLSLRCLLHHYQSPDACPIQLSATILELEDMVQNEASRKRWKFLAHLPMTGTIRLAEIQMSSLLPATALTPFSEEIAAREKRRHRKELDSHRATAKEAASAAAAKDARLGPSAAELRLMPSLLSSSTKGSASSTSAGAASAGSGVMREPVVGHGAGGLGGEEGPGGRAAALRAAAAEMGMSAVELEESMALQASLDESSLLALSSSAPGTSPPVGGISFAHMTRLGYAATGPTLGSSPGATAATALGVWAGKGGPNSAGKAASPVPTAPQLTPLSWVLSPIPSTSTTAEGPTHGGAGQGRKGSKKGALLFTTTQRKY